MKDFCYTDERFADLQMLRYRLTGFEQLSLQQKRLIFCLSKAALFGRDITFDQYGRYNLRIRKPLEVVYTDLNIDRDTDDFRALEIYLKRVWFSNGIYHHYGCEKFKPDFSEEYLRSVLHLVEPRRLPLDEGQTVDALCQELFPVIFDPAVQPKRVNKADGEDLLQTSSCNFYDGVTQAEAEAYYSAKRTRQSSDALSQFPPSYGLNSTLVKRDGQLFEDVWYAKGRYSNAIRHIVHWLREAAKVAENDSQRSVIDKLVEFYETGDLHLFDEYSIRWLQCLEGRVDFINGFIEVYGDPLGLKGTWEALVEYIDEEATHRTRIIAQNAQWFEDHSPVDPRFRKSVVKGVSANVICAAMLGGEEYPSTAIGINLPNADWIRAQYGSKSITISNITDAYNKASHGSGFKEEFIIDADTLALVEKYGDVCDDLHTDLHECLGHGGGQLLTGVDPDALKAYGNTIEEARADLFALYYIADRKLVELGLVPDGDAYKSQYYTYMMNGLMTQLIRITPGSHIEEAHMRNRALIAHWCAAQGSVVSLIRRNDKTYLYIADYHELRKLFAKLLAEVQRIKSEGDFEAARDLVERYAVKVDADLHAEVLERYRRLNLAPYKGFINPQMLPVTDSSGNVVDIQLNYSESYAHQMLRYGSEYGTLI